MNEEVSILVSAPTTQYVYALQCLKLYVLHILKHGNDNKSTRSVHTLSRYVYKSDLLILRMLYVNE